MEPEDYAALEKYETPYRTMSDLGYEAIMMFIAAQEQGAINAIAAAQRGVTDAH